MFINPRIEIKESPIQGKGLFAVELIKKGEHVWVTKDAGKQESKVYTDNEFKEFTEWCMTNGKEWDAVSLGDGTHRAAISDRKNNPENYGNHSCSPNLDLNHTALRDIQAGEELTVDYRLLSPADWEMECNCGSEACTGSIKGLV